MVIVLTILTSYVVESEAVINGIPTTEFGILFPLYLFHVLAYLCATTALTVQAQRCVVDRKIQGQFHLIGKGLAATSGIALVTNVFLPFWFGDFRFCDFGTLSVLFFVSAIAYAVFMHGLLDLKFVLSKAIVGGLLLTFVVGGYSSGVFLITQYLSEGENKASSPAQFVVLFLAFSFDPLQRLLEEKTDDLLFGKKKNKSVKGNRHKKK
ncbi:MAG: hypothetical protein EOP06_05185 [Proteobacteria bacterium]|nr:MAG: hypothetical protein EOP06_05185 [Pseudomonadota bacterium]